PFLFTSRQHSVQHFFFYCYVHHRYLHSFPTRRSSDLGRRYGSTFCARSPGRKPRRSPASTAGRTSTMRFTLSRSSASTAHATARDRKSTRLNSSHVSISYAVFCLKKKKTKKSEPQECR